MLFRSRKELVKGVHKRMEEAKVEIRSHRRDAQDEVAVERRGRRRDLLLRADR